jgi:glycosyltransferase involved in cell wall biosynthesis
MEQGKPKVSIGLAVYNGGNYLKYAIDTILSQTFTDFELIISDNASTDNTEEICKAYAAQDSRIHYSRNQTNIGGANNENRTVLMSRGKYFRWAAHDDTVCPTLLARCVEVLDQDSSIVVCSTMVNEIDEAGNVHRTISEKRGESLVPHERFYDWVQENHNCEATYGLMRMDVLRKTKLQKNYTGSDRTLLCELALYGRYFEIQEPLFNKRYHSQNMYINMRTRMAWFNPAYKGKIVFPYWMQLIDYLTMIWRVPTTFSEKLYCYKYMLRWIWDHAKNLIGDLVLAVIALFRNPEFLYKSRTKDKDAYNWE